MVERNKADTVPPKSYFTKEKIRAITEIVRAVDTDRENLQAQALRELRQLKALVQLEEKGGIVWMRMAGRRGGGYHTPSRGEQVITSAANVLEDFGARLAHGSEEQRLSGAEITAFARGIRQFMKDKLEKVERMGRRSGSQDEDGPSTLPFPGRR